MFPLYFVSIYGIPILIDMLRESCGREIIIQKHIKRKEFLDRLNKTPVSKVLLMKLFYYKYVREGELYKYMSELTKDDCVSCFECDEYILHIIPNDSKIYKYEYLYNIIVMNYLVLF